MLLVGCTLDRAPGAKYAAALRFAELDVRAPLPKVGTIHRWREKLPDDFVLSLRAPRAAVVSARGPLRPDDEQARALDWTLRAADAVGARAVVISTPPELTPGARSRDLLAAFAEALPRADAERMWVWAYRGPWEAPQAHTLAGQLGLVCAFDPLHDERPPGPRVYAQLRALGARTSYSDAVLEDALERINEEPTELGLITIDAQRAFSQASRLQRAIDADL
jgi:uncharacterized protein YecE (DUF72 family)